EPSYKTASCRNPVRWTDATVDVATRVAFRWIADGERTNYAVPGRRVRDRHTHNGLRGPVLSAPRRPRQVHATGARQVRDAAGAACTIPGRMRRGDRRTLSRSPRARAHSATATPSALSGPKSPSVRSRGERG